MLVAAAMRFPQNGVARPTIRRVVAHIVEQRGEPAARAWLAEHAAAFRGTDEDQTIGYEIALSLDREGKKQEAHDALLESARAHPYPRAASPTTRCVRAAKIDEELGAGPRPRSTSAILLATHEVSHGFAGKYDMASYERPRFPEARSASPRFTATSSTITPPRAQAFEAYYRDHRTARKRDSRCGPRPASRSKTATRKAACALTDASPASSPTPATRRAPARSARAPPRRSASAPTTSSAPARHED